MDDDDEKREYVKMKASQIESEKEGRNETSKESCVYKHNSFIHYLLLCIIKCSLRHLPQHFRKSARSEPKSILRNCKKKENAENIKYKNEQSKRKRNTNLKWDLNQQDEKLDWNYVFLSLFLQTWDYTNFKYRMRKHLISRIFQDINFRSEMRVVRATRSEMKTSNRQVKSVD